MRKKGQKSLHQHPPLDSDTFTPFNTFTTTVLSPTVEYLKYSSRYISSRFQLFITRSTILRHFHVCGRVGQASWTWCEYSADSCRPLRSLLPVQAQTPQQRRANERYARQEAAKRGKPESAIKQKQNFSPSISPIWIGALSEHQGDGIQ